VNNNMLWLHWLCISCMSCLCVCFQRTCEFTKTSSSYNGWSFRVKPCNFRAVHWIKK